MIWRKKRLVCALFCLILGSLAEDNKECPPNWQQYNGFCYINSKTKMAVDEGERFCSYFLDSSLLEIGDAAENRFVTNLTVGKSWLGFRRCSKLRFFWTDSEAANFTNWDISDGQPDNKDTNEGCVSMSKTGNWSDNICYEKKAFVCQKVNKKCSKLEECYILKPSSVSWREARSKCEQDGLRLAKIMNIDENRAVTSLLQGTGTSDVWIGLERRNNFCMKNSSRTIFHVWDFHEPNDKNLAEDCIAIGGQGKWSDEQCNSNLTIICKRDLDECLNKEAHGCDENSACQNTVGSFSCNTCKDGYSRDGEMCSRTNVQAIVLGSLFAFSCVIIFVLCMYIVRKSRRWVW